MQWVSLLSYLFDVRQVSVQFSHSVASDTLWPHGPQNTRLPCPSPANFLHIRCLLLRPSDYSGIYMNMAINQFIFSLLRCYFIWGLWGMLNFMIFLGSFFILCQISDSETLSCTSNQRVSNGKDTLQSSFSSCKSSSLCVIPGLLSGEWIKL